MAYFLLLYNAESHMCLTVWMFEYCQLQHNKQTFEGKTFGGKYNKGVGAVLITASRVRVNGHGILGGFFLMPAYSHPLSPFTRHWNVLYTKLSIRKELGKGRRQHDQDRRRVAIEFHS
jgi:hypothetical protein